MKTVVFALLFSASTMAQEVKGIYVNRGTNESLDPIIGLVQNGIFTQHVQPEYACKQFMFVWTLRDLGITSPVGITGSAACLFDTSPGKHHMFSLQKMDGWQMLGLHNARGPCSVFAIPGGYIRMDPDDQILEEQLCLDRVIGYTIYYRDLP